MAQLLDVPEEFTTPTTVRHVRAEGLVNMDERSVLSRVSVRDGQAFQPSALTEKVQILQRLTLPKEKAHIGMLPLLLEESLVL